MPEEEKEEEKEQKEEQESVVIPEEWRKSRLRLNNERFSCDRKFMF